MKKAVIFDLDGLLVNSEIVTYKLYSHLLETYGQHMEIEEYIHDYSGKTARINMESLIEENDLPISVEDGLAFVAKKEQDYLERGIALKPGAIELLDYLKEHHYKILLASSSNRDRALCILKKNKIDTYFDKLVFGTEVKRGKPYPDIFIKASEYAGERPSDCLVLEDSEAGIMAAYSAGIDVICIPDLKMPEVRFCKLTLARLKSLEEVIPYL